MNDINCAEDEAKLIVEKYQKGREKILGQIRDDEDPEVKEISRIDRYGFIHEKLLPPKLTKFEAKVRMKEAARSEKWIKMTKQWDKYSIHSEKLRKRVFKGIPDAVRGEVWTKLMGVPQVKKEQEGRYQEMLNFGLQNSQSIRQIDLDINRTFRNNIIFRDRYNTKQQELFNVLVAYSVYNAEIGYTQGMSQIAALLLMYTLNEEDAFWSLDRLMSSNKYAMHGFFIDGFPKFNRFTRHHELILKKFLPRVYKHFKKFNINSTFYTVKWFFQCFLDRVPFSLTLRIWDCFMLEGEMILTCMSYTLLKLHKKTILKKGMEDLLSFLQTDLEKDFGYLDDQAIKELQISILELKRYNMELPNESSPQDERPSKPFGMLLQADNLSIMTGTDDRSIAGSIILKTSDSTSLAQTSKTESDVEPNELENDVLDDVEVNDFCYLQRSFSLYDNVDIHESIEAAKRLSSYELTTSSMSKDSKNQSISKSLTKSDTQEVDDSNTKIDKQCTEEDYLILNVTPTNEFNDFVIINPDESYFCTQSEIDDPIKQTCDDKLLGEKNQNGKEETVSSFEIQEEIAKLSPTHTSENKNVLQDWPDRWVLIKSSKTFSNESSQSIIESKSNYKSFVEDLSTRLDNLSKISKVSHLETIESTQKCSNLKSTPGNVFSNHSESSESSQSFLIRKTSIPRLKSRVPQTNLCLEKSGEKKEKKLEQKTKAISSSPAVLSTSFIPRLNKKSLGSINNKFKVNNSSHQNQIKNKSNSNIDKKEEENKTQTPDAYKLHIYVPFGTENVTPKDVNKIKNKLPEADDNIHHSYLPSIDS